jgi:hypothetical protein
VSRPTTCAARPVLRATQRALVLAAGLAVAGCASTSVTLTPPVPQASSCQASTEQLTALVLWGVEWRPDQKDVPRRELAAEQGIKSFFGGSSCFTRADVRRVPSTSVAQSEQVPRLAATAQNRPDRVLVITVHELGPVLRLLSSWALVEGGTEVVLDVSEHDLTRAMPPQEFKVHWQNGGPGVIKGVASLPADMEAALTASLKPTTVSK